MIRNLLIAFSLLLLLVSACSEQKAEPQAEEQKASPKELQVVVPDFVAGQWQSVKISLHDQETGAENIYQVDIGGSFQIPGTSLRVTVESFLPAFSVNAKRATSVTNQPTNPAMLIVVREGEQEIHRGWVFGLYPERHQYMNPRYKFVLLDYKPAG
jgi:hypothetical protein